MSAIGKKEYEKIVEKAQLPIIEWVIKKYVSIELIRKAVRFKDEKKTFVKQCY